MLAQGQMMLRFVFTAWRERARARWQLSQTWLALWRLAWRFAVLRQTFLPWRAWRREFGREATIPERLARLRHHLIWRGFRLRVRRFNVLVFRHWSLVHAREWCPQRWMELDIEAAQLAALARRRGIARGTCVT